jgi:hypothetical protein
MFDKTIDMLKNSMVMLGKEMDGVWESIEKHVDDIWDSMEGKRTTIRIKKGSKVIINGALAELKTDALVETNDPLRLMRKKAHAKK